MLYIDAVSLSGMYRFAMVKCLFLSVSILTNCSSVLCVLFLEMSKWVNVMLCLMLCCVLFLTSLLCLCVECNLLFWVFFGCGGEFGFLYCYDVWLCCVCELSKLLLFVCDVVDVYL